MAKVSFAVAALAGSTALIAKAGAAGRDEPTHCVQAGGMVTAQPAGIPNHRVTPPISGRTIGLAAAVGFFVTPTLAVEGEVVGRRAISTPQRFCSLDASRGLDAV
jgi:hypothetical protein